MRRQRHGYKSILSASRSLLTRPPWIHLVPLPNMYRGLHRLPLPYMYQYSQLCDSARAKIAVSEEDYRRTRSQLEEEVAEKYAGIKLSIYGTIVDKIMSAPPARACRLWVRHPAPSSASRYPAMQVEYCFHKVISARSEHDIILRRPIA